ASNWSHLHTVWLTNLPMNLAAYDALDQMKSLRCLKLHTTNPVDFELNPTNLGEFSQAATNGHHTFWGRLEELALLNVGNVDEIIHRLDGSPNLRKLLVDDSFSISTTRELHRFQKLEWLELKARTFKDQRAQSVDDELVRNVARLKTLKIIRLNGSLSPAQIKMLTGCPWFSSIVLSSNAYSTSTMKSLTASDPRIRFMDL
ncbi:MAG: hypothetical protein ACRD3W_28915, partial [Terriglobales bacterium]